MSGIARRRFLTGAAALAGGATVVACAAPERESRVQSFVHSPEQTLPGQELWFATACAHSTGGNSVVVRTVDGRAKKVEGTKGFPVNLGKTNVRGQAGVQSLYNPDRLKTPLRRRGTRGEGRFEAIGWPEALDLLTENFGSAGNPLVVTGPMSGTRLRVLAQFLANSEGRHLVYEAQDTATLREAARLIFGYTRLPHFDIANAGAVLSFGADFLGTWLSPVHYSTAYGKFREEPHRGRLIQIESHMSLTGANADRWVYVNPGHEGALALSIAQVIAAENLTGDDRWFDPVNAVGGIDALNAYAPELTAARTGVAPDAVREIAREFVSHPPALTIAGGAALAQTNGLDNAAAALLLNRIVGSTGAAGGVRPNPAAPAAVPGTATATPFNQWGALATGLLDGSETVDAAFFYDVDPVYGLPATTRFADALDEMSFVVGMGTFLNETLARADLVLPATHPFEEWGDFVADPAPNMEVVGYQQPVVTSWTTARSFGDVMLTLTSELFPDAPPPWTTMRDAVRDGAQALIGQEGFDHGWIELLRTGGRWGEGEGREALAEQPDWHINLLAEPVFAGDTTKFDLHLIPFENVAFGAGSESANPWLQATPDPLTTVTWTTWAELNPATAQRLGVKRNDVVHIDTPDGTLRARVYEAPVAPPDVVAVPIGQGREFGSRWSVERGANVMQTLAAQAVAGSGALAWGATRARVRPAGEHDRLPTLEVIEDPRNDGEAPPVRITSG